MICVALKNSFQNVLTLLLKQKILIFICLLEYDIDGATLEMMNNMERISTVIPTFKLQLLFLKEREKLFQTNNNLSIQYAGSSSSTSSNLNSSSESFTNFDSTSNSSTNLNSSSSMELLSNSSLNESTNQSDSQQSLDEQEIKPSFPDKYVIPALPDAVLKDIEEGAVHKFGPHYSNRQVLVDAVAHDLMKNYKIL